MRTKVDRDFDLQSGREIERKDAEIAELRGAVSHVLQRCNDNGGQIDAELVAELKAACEQKSSKS